MAGEKHLHQGHRQRMRKRIAEQGFASLAEHEALEVLLYTTNPQKDTNALAHALLERFGSFAGVLEASEQELCTVEGIGPASARLLHLMPQVSQYYQSSRAGGAPCLRTAQQAADYLMSRFQGADCEKALLVTLDRRSRVKGLFWLREGSGSRIQLEVKDVVEAAIRGGTESVLLCHNHPNGIALPSREDLLATENIVRALGLLHIQLRDHLILTESEFFSMREEGRLPFYEETTGTLICPYPRE